MKPLSRAIDLIADLGGQVAAWLVPLLMLLVLFEVFMRYVIGQPPILADEFGGYLLVGMSYLGLAHTWKAKGHVRVTFLVDRLPRRAAGFLRLATLVIAFVFSVILIVSSYLFLALSLRLGLASSSWVHFPLQGIQATLAVGFVSLSLSVLLEIVRTASALRGASSPR